VEFENQDLDINIDRLRFEYLCHTVFRMPGFTHEWRVKERHSDLGYYDPEESDINLPVPSDFQLFLNLTFIILFCVIFDKICLSKSLFLYFIPYFVISMNTL